MFLTNYLHNASGTEDNISLKNEVVNQVFKWRNIRKLGLYSIILGARSLDYFPKIGLNE